MEPTETKGTPFKGELIESEFDTSRLFEFEDSPDIVVRFRPAYVEDSIEDFIERINLAKQEFEALNNTFGIAVPEFQMVVGKGKSGERVGVQGIYIVTSKIDGEKFTDFFNVWTGDVDDEVAAEIDRTYAGLVRYFSDRFSNNQSYLYDIGGPRQYVYGKEQAKGKDQDKKLYLVDLDPFVVEPYKFSLQDRIETMKIETIRSLGIETPELDKELRTARIRI